LLPDALCQECWNKFAELVPQLQQSVVAAVRSSLLANVSITTSGKQSGLSEHFMHIIDNEHNIMSLEQGPLPHVDVDTPSLEFEAIDGTLYKKLSQLLTFGYRSEEKLLKALADCDMSHHKPGDTGTLLFHHEATVEARRAGSAEVLSILHAAAAKGLVRVCARFIAEGLDVNEKAGIQEVTPLHLASTHGEVEVVKLLLKRDADANARDGQGHSPLYRLVEAAAQLGQRGDSCAGSSPPNHAPKTHHSLLREAGFELLRMGAENVPEGSSTDGSQQQSPEKLAQQESLHELRNMIRLHERLRKLARKFLLGYEQFDELCKMQYETGCFVAYVFEHNVHLGNTDAAPTEFRAFIESEFIQERDKVQKFANRLAKRLSLSKKACDALVALPPAAGLHALRTWSVEELIPHVYDVPDHLNAPPPPPQQPPPPPPTLDVSGNQLGDLEDASVDVAKAEEEEPKLQGRVRKWDSERGFGFIVQDPRPGEEADKDIFVHRKNIVGSTPANHLDLRENCRISYRLGEQDGRPRALDATMIDSNGNILPVHFPGMSGSAGAKNEPRLDGPLEDDSDEEETSRKFLRHLRSHGVQEVAREKRPENESFLRCVGLKKHNPGRRDEAIWKKEIDRRIDVFLSWNTTPLQKRDFDFRVRRFLHEVCIHSSVSKVSEALAMVETSTAGKRRDEIRSWPAYLATLLRRYDSKLYELLAERDRRSRVEQRRARMEATASEFGESIKDESTLASVVGSVAGDRADSVAGDCIDIVDEEDGADAAGSFCEDKVSSSGEASAAAIAAQEHASSASSARSTPREGSPEPSSQQSNSNPPSTLGAQQPPPPPQQPRVTPTPTVEAASPARGLFAAAIRAAGALPSGSAPQPRRTFQ
jgi:cold shock CspA family protein